MKRVIRRIKEMNTVAERDCTKCFIKTAILICFSTQLDSRIDSAAFALGQPLHKTQHCYSPLLTVISEHSRCTMWPLLEFLNDPNACLQWEFVFNKCLLLCADYMISQVQDKWNVWTEWMGWVSHGCTCRLARNLSVTHYTYSRAPLSRQIFS